MESLISLVASGVFVLVAASIGRQARGLLRPERCPASEALLVDAAMGLGIVSLAVFALAACQLLRMPWGLVAGVALAVCGAAKLAGVVGDAAALLRTAIATRCLASWLVGMLLLILALATLIPALAPPAMSDWDSLAYHLTVPKLYLQHGGFFRIDFASHSNFPFLMEMLYTPWVALGLPAGAKMMHYWTGVLLVLSVAVLVRRHLNPKAAPMAAMAIGGMPVVLWEATTAYIDLAAALYTTVAVHMLLSHLDTSDRRLLVGCGAAAGFAASTKMTGLVLLPLLVVWMVTDGYAQRRKLVWRNALALAGVGLVVCAPWYAKSLIYTGNPVYPFLYSVFGGRGWTAGLASNYTMLQKHFGMGHDFAALLMVPFNLTFHSEAFYDTPGLYMGPLFLVLVPVLLLGRYGSRRLVGLGAFFAAQLVIWFVLSQQSRYLIPAFATLAALGAGIVHADDRLRLAGRALMAAFVLTALFGLATVMPACLDTSRVVFGAEPQARYLLRSLDIYQAQSYMNARLPRNSKVALFGDTRGFYLDRDFVWADPGHNSEFTRSYGSIEDFVDHLRRVGVTHAMVNFRFHPPPDKAEGAAKLLYEAVEEGRFRLVFPVGDSASRVAVYELK